MVQPQRRALSPRNAVIAGVLLLVAVIGAFWVPIYARSAPKLGDFPFFYWFQLIWMPVVMVLCYLAYLLLREGIEDPERRARFGAVYTLVGAISVPITFFSIRYLRTIHPVVVAGSNDAAGSFHMEPQMLQTMLFAILAFSIIFVTLFWHRIRLGQFAEKIEQLKLEVTQ